MNKDFFICGNWKLNHLLDETKKTLRKIVENVENIKNIKIALAPVIPLINLAVEITRFSNISIVAQNVFYKEKGAFTGEWSVMHLKELGCKYAIIGHSERRIIFNETNYDIAKKTLSCLDGGIIPIVCIGETLLERKNGDMKKIIKKQISYVLDLIVADDLEKLVLAYEPIWAIGTGRSATSMQAEEMHDLIRKLLIYYFGEKNAKKTYILYGGSVNIKNISQLLSEPNIDGVLIGGASLIAESFCQLIKKAKSLTFKS